MNVNLVSIITVTYNAQEFIERTIKSIFSQTYPKIEYIIIDGNSNDSTVSIIEKYNNKISYWESKKDKGVFDAMNKAVLYANGKWINFMNAGDTFCSENSVSDVISALNDNTDIVCGDNFIVSENGKKVYSKAPGFENVWSSTIPCNHQSMFVKKSLLISTPFDLSFSLASDYDFILKQYKNNAIFQFLDIPVCNFLVGGMSQTQAVKLQIESLMAISKYAPSLSENLTNNVHLSRLATLLGEKAQHETFLQHFNVIHANIKNLQTSGKRIIIYGAGSLGISIANIIPNIVDCIVDRGDIGTTMDGFTIIKPEELETRKYDYILISLLGREEEISKFLIDEIGVSKNKLYILKLS